MWSTDWAQYALGKMEWGRVKTDGKYDWNRNQSRQDWCVQHRVCWVTLLYLHPSSHRFILIHTISYQYILVHPSSSYFTLPSTVSLLSGWLQPATNYFCPQDPFIVPGHLWLGKREYWHQINLNIQFFSSTSFSGALLQCSSRVRKVAGDVFRQTWHRSLWPWEIAVGCGTNYWYLFVHKDI